MKSTLLAAVVACLFATPVGAVTIVKNYRATATFADGPYQRIVLDFGLSFDPSETNYDERPLLYFTSSVADPAFQGEIAFFNEMDGITIGKPLNGVDAYEFGTNDFSLAFFTDPADGGALLQYTQTAPEDLYTFKVTVDELASPALPEPASWAMLLAGFGLAGAALRRRRLTVRIA